MWRMKSAIGHLFTVLKVLIAFKTHFSLYNWLRHIWVLMAGLDMWLLELIGYILQFLLNIYLHLTLYAFSM